MLYLNYYFFCILLDKNAGPQSHLSTAGSYLVDGHLSKVPRNLKAPSKGFKISEEI